MLDNTFHRWYRAKVQKRKNTLIQTFMSTFSLNSEISMQRRSWSPEDEMTLMIPWLYLWLNQEDDICAFSKISQKLLDGLLLKFGSDNHGAKRMNLCDFGNPLVLLLASRGSKNFKFSLKYLNIYCTDFETQTWNRCSCSPQDELK